MDYVLQLSRYNQIINEFIWNKLGLSFLIASGLIACAALRFFQIFHIKLWWKNTFCTIFSKNVSSQRKRGTITPFQSACTALAATIGVGNIVGVTSALVMGGPGAIFWMWIAALMGMAIGYCENVLGIYFRQKNFDGSWSGGPMYYLRYGLGNIRGFKTAGRILAAVFAIFTVLASFGIGAMGQANKIVINLESAFPITPLAELVIYDNITVYSLIIGLLVFLSAAVIVVGGINRIASIAEKLVPFMIVFFMVGSLAVIAVNYNNIIPSLKSIVSSAFNVKSGMGGLVGTGLVTGFKRGVFSNEAGMGSSVLIHGSSECTEPCEQGMWSIFEVFVDTVIMCTLTALAVMCSGVYNAHVPPLSGRDATMMADAFNTVFVFGNFGEKFIALSILMFAFTSILGWNHCGTKAWEYLFDTKYIRIYKALHLVSIIAGSLLTSSLAWDISDTFNGLMMLPNLIGVVLLMPLVVKIHRQLNYKNKKTLQKTL